MSYIHMLIIKDDCIYLTSVHYRTAMKLLEKGIDSILPLLKSRFLDAGYIVLDINRQVIVNGQAAFPISKVLGKKNICVIEA